MHLKNRRIGIFATALTVLISAVASAQVGTPVQISGGGSIPDGQATTDTTTWRVPMGKRLIIEFIALQGAVPDGQRVSGVVGTQAAPGTGTSYYQFYTTPYPTTPSFRTDSILNQDVRLYADQGTDVVMWGGRIGGYTFAGYLYVLVSGVLIDIPPPAPGPSAGSQIAPAL